MVVGADQAHQRLSFMTGFQSGINEAADGAPFLPADSEHNIDADGFRFGEQKSNITDKSYNSLRTDHAK